jgi:hypothetical protein
MNNKIILSIFSLLILSATLLQFTSCNDSNAQDKANAFTYATVQINFDDPSISYKNLRLYPIRAKDNLNNQQKDYGKFVSLQEALKTEKVEISEKSIVGQNSDEVNKLYVENTSSDTVVLLAGEIVKGGKQDRTLANDVVLAPGKGKVDLEVFCVEHGRWDEKDQNRVVNKPMEEKKFKQTTAIVKPSVRKNASVDKEQTKVWQKVDEANTKANNQTTTSAYTAFDENMDYQKQEKEYLAFFKAKMPNDERIIGVVAVSGNRVIGCDIFATRQLFTDAWSKLLPSYINEAINDGAQVNIAPSDVKKYTDQLLTSEQKQEAYLEKNGKLFKHNNRIMHLASY